MAKSTWEIYGLFEMFLRKFYVLQNKKHDNMFNNQKLFFVFKYRKYDLFK